jgi:hypothetical protein
MHTFERPQALYFEVLSDKGTMDGMNGLCITA